MSQVLIRYVLVEGFLVARLGKVVSLLLVHLLVADEVLILRIDSLRLSGRPRASSVLSLTA